MAERDPDAHQAMTHHVERSTVYTTPAVQAPSIKKMEKIAKKIGFDISDKDMADYHAKITSVLSIYEVIDRLPEPIPETRYPRLPGYRPGREENTHNAWYWKTDIPGAASGPLAGKTIAIKDNVAVAGVPMMNGSRMLEGYTPEFDATVVTRFLDAGGRITGKAANSDLLCDGCSYTVASGTMLNAIDKTRSAGGSSGGCGILVALGEVDIGLGSDQGGSIRVPSAFNGVVGLKPTWGLVPYTGSMGMEPAFDHLGPLTKTVYDCALCMEVIAGNDGLDFRQKKDIVVPKYTEALTGDLSGMKIGIVPEGFKDSEADVESTVRQAAQRLSSKGATVEDVNVPMHTEAWAVYAVIVSEGSGQNLFETGGINYGFRQFQPTTMIDFYKKTLECRANDLSPGLKMFGLFYNYIKETTGNKYYAKAMNLVRTVTQAYDDVLRQYDVLIMPTMRFKPPKLPSADVGVAEYLTNATNTSANTGIFDATGHPALSINAGFSEGLPIGMMIVGKHFDDATVMKVAHAWETIRDAKK